MVTLFLACEETSCNVWVLDHPFDRSVDLGRVTASTFYLFFFFYFFFGSTGKMTFMDSSTAQRYSWETRNRSKVFTVEVIINWLSVIEKFFLHYSLGFVTTVDYDCTEFGGQELILILFSLTFKLSGIAHLTESLTKQINANMSGFPLIARKHKILLLLKVHLRWLSVCLNWVLFCGWNDKRSFKFSHSCAINCCGQLFLVWGLLKLNPRLSF